MCLGDYHFQNVHSTVLGPVALLHLPASCPWGCCSWGPWFSRRNLWSFVPLAWVFLLSLPGRPNTYLRGRGVKNKYCFLWISFSRKKYLSKWKCIKLRLSLCLVFLIQDSCYMTRSLTVLTYYTKTRFWKVHSPPPSLITSFPLDLSFSASDFYPFY